MNDEILVHEAPNRVRGFVAEVVSDREVILNRGSDQGVFEGMYFAILNPASVNVTDPESGETLGGIRMVKIVVRAVDVGPRLTLARTFRTRTVNTGGTAAGLASFANMLAVPNYVEQVEKLTISPDTPRKIDPANSIVERGDPFESATPEEAEDTRSVTVWEER